MNDTLPRERRTAWERRVPLDAAADRAEWDVPEGRIGGVIRQLRRRAEGARRRSSGIFLMLLVVILLGIGFYLGLPFFRLSVDGQRVTLQKTLTNTAAAAADLRADMQAQARAYADALRQSFIVIATPTETHLWGHAAIGDDLLFYGEGGMLLRWGDMLFHGVLARVSAVEKAIAEAFDDGAINAPRDLALDRDMLAALLAHRGSLDIFHRPRVETTVAVATALGGRAIPIGNRWTDASQGLTKFYGFPYSLIWDRERNDFAGFLADCRGGHVTVSAPAVDADVQAPLEPHSESLTKACLEGWNAKQAAQVQT